MRSTGEKTYQKGQVVRSEADFEAYVRTRGVALVRYAFALCRDEGRAEDLVQSVLARLFGRWARIAHLDDPDAYVRRAIVNEYLSWRRRLGSRELAATVDAGETPDPTAGVDERDSLDRLIGRLPRRQRAVLVLRYYEDLPDEEIAAILRCSRSNVRALAARALTTLRGDVEPLPARGRSQ